MTEHVFAIIGYAIIGYLTTGGFLIYALPKSLDAAFWLIELHDRIRNLPRVEAENIQLRARLKVLEERGPFR